MLQRTGWSLELSELRLSKICVQLCLPVFCQCHAGADCVVLHLDHFRVVEMSYSSRPSHDETVNERLVADSDDEFAHLIRSIGLKHRCEMMWCCRRRGM